MTTAYVLGGGGHLGAHEVGMLRALHEHDITPDTIVGTSIGALNGAVFATTGDERALDRLADLWTSLDRSGILDTSLRSRLKTLWETKTHLHDNDRFRELVTDAVGTDSFDDLTVPFECVAASIERSTAAYLSSGSLVDAVLASSAVPGLLPPVEIGGEHHLDGGLVASIPLDRAVRGGATTIYVLQVGRIEDPLVTPSRPWEVAMIAFEISRRHRFAEAMQTLPDGVDVHVLPTGDAKAFNDLRQYGGANSERARERIGLSYTASSTYLDAQLA